MRWARWLSLHKLPPDLAEREYSGVLASWTPRHGRGIQSLKLECSEGWERDYAEVLELEELLSSRILRRCCH